MFNKLPFYSKCFFENLVEKESTVKPVLRDHLL